MIELLMQKKRRESGQGLLEFALLLPVFLLAAMMIVDLGRTVYFYNVVYNAAREGARAGVIDSSDGNVDAAAIHLSSGFLKDSNVTSQLVTIVGPSGEDYDVLEVTVNYDFKAATPFLGRLTGSPGNNIVLRSTATMQLER